VWLGLGAAGGFFAAGLPVAWGDPLGIAAQAAYSLYFVWIAFALPALVRGTATDVVALAPSLRAGPVSPGAAVFEGGRRAVTVGIAVGFAVAAFDTWFFSGLVEGEPGSAPALAVVALREVVVCFFAFAVLGWAVGAARALSRVVHEQAEVNLLDPRALSPLGRCGARLALWWLLMLALTFPPLLLPQAREMLLLVALLTLGYAAMAGVALAIPTWGAHRALATAKQDELAQVREELRRARAAGEETRIPGLIAWEQRIEAVSVWPIDARSLRLTALYVLIPFASWIAGALVERGVDAALG
jgi:hypothetical protein